MLSVVATLLIAGLAMAPGLLLPRGACRGPGQWAAAATVSLVLTMAITALLGAAAGLAGLSLPAPTIVAVSLAAAAAVWFHGRKSGEPVGPPLTADWQAWTVAAFMVGYGLLSLTVGFTERPDGTLLIHAWYNADWFKHIGHVHGLADYGVPARDIFGGGGPLHYYWLVYLLPGAGAAVGGDAWAALATANAIVNALFGLLLFAAMRRCGGSRAMTLAASLIAIVAIAPAGFFVHFLTGGTLQSFFDQGVAPSGSALLALSGVIPQHALAMAILLAWALLATGETRAPLAPRIAALLALTALPAMSTLLGAVLLIAYGLLGLYRERLRAVPELAAVAVGAIAVTLALGVIDIGHPGSAIASPLLTNAPDPRPTYVLALLAVIKLAGLTGLPAFVAIFAVRHWRPAGETERAMKELALALAAAAIVGVMVTQLLLPNRLAEETFIRASIPLSVGAALVGAWLIRVLWAGSARQRRWLVVGVVAALVVGVPAHVTRMAWTGNFGPSYTTEVGPDDRRALAELRRLSGPRDMVWQYPEKPLLALPAGEDSWSPIFAGRTVPNSERATDYAAAAPFIAASEEWFAGRAAAIPETIGWVYLSRALHPASFDALVARMRSDPAWAARACYPDACVFSRRPRAAAANPASPNSASPAIPTTRASNATSAIATVDS